MKNISKRILSFGLSAAMVLGLGIGALASNRREVIEEDANSVDQTLQSLIYQIVDSQDKQDWQRFASYHPTNDKEYFNNEIADGIALTENNGVFCVRSAHVKFVQPINLTEIERYSSLDDLKNMYGELFSYFVGIDYQVAKEGKSFYNGVNYRFFIFGRENNEWRLVGCHEAPIDMMAAYDRTIMSDIEDENSDMAKAALIHHARIQGAIVGSDGTVLEIVSDDYTGPRVREPFGYRGSYTASSCACTSRPSTIKVLYGGQTKSVARATYIKDVIPNEWVISSADPASLDAAIVVIQQYVTWNTLVYDKYPNYSYDMKASSADQNYVDGSYNALASKYRTKIDTAYNNTSGYYLFNSAGNLFESQYANGQNDSSGKAGGQLKQAGSDYLATNASYKYDWKKICSYYYDNSPKSTKAITFKTY